MGSESLMATNNFKPFAIGNGANVSTQADYEALAALATGFQAGKASSAQINKALRQATVMAYVLAQYISDTAAVDVLDNGNPANLLANLKSGFLSSTPGRLINVQVFSASGTWAKTAGAKKALIKCWGAGGGGGNTSTAASGGGSGAGGGYSEGMFDISTLTSATVVVGSGGTSVAANIAGSGGNGGSSSVGGLISAGGGNGGTSSSGSSPGASTNGGTIFAVSGQGGQGPVNALGGVGGGAFNSFGGLPHSAGVGDQGGFPGGGGAGGTKATSTSYFASGAGANGYVIITEYA
ncbi:hypothetical protein 7AX3_51 [uncultured Caudovirales phage]|uniref:Glycine-rich domain-containing protein n=2 Tax=root TaxID=1 RepID=A0A2H4J9P7_9CAUD|nr:hypothetical protein 7AX3_51 [uncultured Caudovirales phage]